MDTAITTFLSGLGFDLEVFETFFPAVSAYYDIIQGFAVGLLFIMLVFQLFRNFGIVLDIEAEDPLKMLGKTALFFGMIIYSRSILDLILKLLTDPYSIFLNAYSAEIEFSLLDMLDKMLGGFTTAGFMSIVYIIMLLMLGWQFLKFIVEVVERYVVFFFVLQCAPVVFATGAFKSTSQIFKSWCRMLGSQALLLLLNVWSIKLFTSFMTVFDFSSDDIIFSFLMGYGFLKFSQKADTLLRILGLNTASTGDVIHSLGSTVGGIAQMIRTTGGMASRAFGGKSAFASKAQSNSNGANGNGGNNQSGGIGMQGENNRSETGNANGANDPNASSGGINNNVSRAAQAYSNDVISNAKMQMKNHSGADSSSSDESATSINEPKSQNGSIRSDGTSPISGIDAETREGLTNLAHGLPHNKFDAKGRKFSGGGFSEFTSENANIIGASQLTPADGYSHSAIKMPDGTNATLYQNDKTGQSHIVQFGSVDNGVMQGVISDVDPKTGKTGDMMAFKAVHESVPGSASFSAHSIPVADGSSGGAYHVSTGADTSFFKTGRNDTASTSGGVAPSDHVSSSSIPYSQGSVSAFETGQGSKMQDAGDKIGKSSVSSVKASDTVMSDAQSSTAHSIHSTSDIHGIGAQQSYSGAQSATMQGTSLYAEPNIAASTSASGSTSSAGATYSQQQPLNTSAQKVQSESANRFSRNNPANLEVFKRIEESKIETFPRDAGHTSNLPKKE